MTRAGIAGWAVASGLVLLAVGAGFRARKKGVDPAVATPTAISEAPAITPPSSGAPEEGDQKGFIFGRVTTNGGVTYEGRLRWGGDQEAFWGDYFNGAKDENPWVTQVPPERLPKERDPIEIFGLEIVQRERPRDLGRLFMTRFGDIARIEPVGTDVRVTLKSGTVFDLQRFEASDFDDGVRVWDGERGVVDLDSGEIRSIELFSTAGLGAVPDRLHGTVRTRHGDFTGFVQWNRQQCVGSDEFIGGWIGGELRQRFDTIRSIARSSERILVTLLDGRELELATSREGRYGTLGMYVDDPRYGRVLVSWDAFERLDFSTGGSGPAYGDFPPGRPLAGSVTTRGGRLAGRLVYDLDESETTETLDAPSEGVDYTIPFGLVASIVIPSGDERVRVTLQSGEELQLERRGDFGEANAGMLIFVDGRQTPEYLPWADVEQVHFERPPAMYPPLDGR